MDVQGKIETAITVDTYLQCARCCLQSDVCDGIFYNSTTGYCVIIEIFDGLVINNVSLGKFFRLKKNCLYSGYEYIWQLDSCIMFYYSHLTWSDSKLRCVNDNGNLLTIETARKEYILLPFLMEKFEKQGLRFWWIGGTDAAQEGIFRWINGENVTYSNWDHSQPDDSSDGIPGADCIRYLIHSMTEAAWRDYDCNDQLRSICENKMFL
ncbi:galactose-specific lectin nattectin-like [Mytilus edulis]|uniref:galactose-specific lectin nattectin-like n=1 Tax=Mytilus edulis TaxID=6550 RepID=UPI0039F0C03F